MTVRWKPLLVLSGLFIVVAVVGVISMAWTLVPKSAAGVLGQARAAAAAGRFEHAEIYFKQALQIEARNALIHEEFAALYREWAAAAPPEKRDELHAQRIEHLVKAANYNKSARGPRQELLETAIAQDSAADAIHWAGELLKVDADAPEAHYILALEQLHSRSPAVPEVRRHLKALDDQKAPPIRRALIRVLLARATDDDKARDAALSEASGYTLPERADVLDQMARIELETIAIQARKDPDNADALVKNLLEHVRSLTETTELAAGRMTRLSQFLELTQRFLTARSAQAQSGGKADHAASIDAIEAQLEVIFSRSRELKKEADLQLYLTHADHLRFRQQRDRCLQVVEEALRSPAAAQPANAMAVMGLHTVAAEMALSRPDDPARYQKATAHVQALLASSEPRFQGFGHLFQGAVELEQSGLIPALSRAGDTSEPAQQAQAAQPKLRASALSHLKLAATQLPSLAEAQARYGVALVLNQEQNLGRQYLQNALRMGNLEPQYQVWAAWTILQAGYPEAAEPILDSLFRQLAQGTVPASLKGTLHQISGELYQARRGPGDLERAASEFEKAAALGKGQDTLIALRQAQLQVQLGHPDAALARLAELRKTGQGGPGAENLAVLILEEQGKKDEARRLLQQARGRFPRSPELTALAASFQIKDGSPEQADQTLKEYLAQDADNVALTMMRAQLLAETLKRPREARELLLAVSERSDNSAPLVQIAQLDIEQNQLEAASATVALIRKRWKEAAAGDILDGQIALKGGKVSAAREHFTEALRKDPDNRVVQFWKAQLDSRTGSVAEAARVLEGLVKDRPSKEVDSGVSLLTAAQSALANLSLQTRNYDDAIRRYEELKRNSETGVLSRFDRWQFITALVARGQWPAAKRELASILNDTKNPPSDDERVQGANVYRQQKEDAAALAQLDYVLKVNPTHAAAVVTRAFIDLDAGKQPEAASILRAALERKQAGKETAPAAFYLMLAAVEYEMPPADSAVSRADAVLKQGLAAEPNSLELVQAQYVLFAAAGDLKRATETLEARAKQDPKGTFRRLLVDKLREQGAFERAGALLRDLVKESPDDENLAAALVQVVSQEAAQAAAAGNLELQRSLDEKALSMIRDYRKRYPSSLVFLEAECDLAARGGDVNRALAITGEIDKLAPSSTAGPVLRARLHARQGKPQEVVKAYSEALERDGRQSEIRLLLAQELFRQRDFEGAVKQARAVLEANKQQLEAKVLEARALSQTGAGAAQKQAAQQAAVDRLEAVIRQEPRYRDSYHALAEIEMSRGRRPAAVSALERGLKANPQDAAAVAMLVQFLTARDAGGQAPSPADIKKAGELAAAISRQDRDGSLTLAAGVGFHKAGQLEQALPLSEQAAARLDSVVAHLNLGDLLLSMAEAQTEPARARTLFERAVGEYERVIKTQPNQIEAVNNKAWILHAHLDQSQQAMDLMQGLLKRVSGDALPGEFFDTLGAIHEAFGRRGDAERSYLKGLDKAPDHPVLNYHFGRLLAADGTRTVRAKGYLAKALAGRDQLSPAMAQEAEGLIKRLSGSISGN